MKTGDFENMLREHSARMQENTAASFQRETEVLLMNHKTENRRKSFAGKGRLIPILAIIAAFLVGTTAFAAGGFTAGWFSSAAEVYEPADSGEFVREEGYEPLYIQSFDNGYNYSRGYVVDNEISDAELGKVEQFKSLSLEYEKDGDIVYFSQERSETPVITFGSVIENYDGTELYGYSYTNKVVPEDYVPTEAELEAEAKGELIISYGSDSVHLMEVRSVSWTVDGINYMLMQMGGKLSMYELCDMAKNIIDM